MGRGFTVSRGGTGGALDPEWLGRWDERHLKDVYHIRSGQLGLGQVGLPEGGDGEQGRGTANGGEGSESTWDEGNPQSSLDSPFPLSSPPAGFLTHLSSSSPVLNCIWSALHLPILFHF